MYTEAEAKEKYCVQTMHLETPLMCDGSGCMAWLWTTTGYNVDEKEIVNVKGRCGLINVSLDSNDRMC